MTAQGIELQIEVSKERKAKLVLLKKEIELEMANFNVTHDGKRLVMEDYNSWRLRKRREILNLEKQIAALKLELDTWYRQRDAARRCEQNAADDAVHLVKIKELEERVGQALRRSGELQARVTEQDGEITRLNRQLDAAIRELNAIPKVLREAQV